MELSSENSPSWRDELTNFFGIDLRGLAAFRIALAFLLLSDLRLRLSDLQAHYTEVGIATRQAAFEIFGSPVHWSAHRLSGTWQFEALLFFIAAVFAVMLLLGYRTRVATFASWALLISLHSQNRFVLTGGDTLLRVMLFWSIFAPLGYHFSIDSWRVPRTATSNLYCTAATAIMLLQICVMYWFTSLFKQHAMWSEDGTALFYSLHIDQLARPWSKALLEYPAALQQLTFATVYLESFGPFLFFVPFNTAWTRPLAVLLLAGFHFGTFLIMDVGLFPWICWACLLLFAPPWIWDALSTQRGRVSTWIFHQLSWPPVGFPKLTKESPQAQPRSSLARVCLQRGTSVVLVLIFAVVIIWNFQNLGSSRSPQWLPPQGGPIISTLWLDQKWNMFSRPELNDGWFILKATLNNGSSVDLRTGIDPSEAKPSSVLATFPNYRWRKLTSKLWFRRYRSLRRYYAEYMIRRWDSEHPLIQQQVSEVQLYYMLERTTATGPNAPKKILLYGSTALSKE